MISLSRIQHSISQVIIVALISLNFFILHSPYLGVILAFLYLWFNSKKISDIFFSHIHQGFKKTLGLIVLLAYVGLCYTLAYHVYRIDHWVFLFVLISLPLLVEIISWQSKTTHYFWSNPESYKIHGLRSLLWPSLVIIFDILIFILISKKASTDLIRSPWELLDVKFWTLFAVSNLALAATFINKRTEKRLSLISWHFFCLASIAVWLYPLGYGYDSFIHLATLKIIDATGTISPHLFLYLGQYGLTFFGASLSQFDLALVNKLLLPALFALLWPSSLFYGLKYGWDWRFKSSYLAVLWSIFIGLSFFIMTTPQGLAFLLFAIYIFVLPLFNKGELKMPLLWLLALFTLSIHPLSGLPLLALNLIIFASRLSKIKWLRLTMISLSWLLALIALPLFFVLYELLNGRKIAEILTIRLWPLFNQPTFYWQQSYNFPLDLIHNIWQNHILLYVVTCIVGLFLIIINHKQIFFRKIFSLLVILLANYIIARAFLTFDLNIGYQKNAYLERILFMLEITSLPIFLTTIYYASRDILLRPNKYAKLWFMMLTVLILNIAVYFSYPVYDRHFNSKSFNVTATDIATVQMIEDASEGRPYIVLANQMVGAAAINQFGFAHYYNNNFYYSMPLGTDNIYQNYLAMIEKEASRDEANLAMDKAGVNDLYFVVNNYWHSAKTAISQASQSADQKYEVNGGQNVIFFYKR